MTHKIYLGSTYTPENADPSRHSLTDETKKEALDEEALQRESIQSASKKQTKLREYLTSRKVSAEPQNSTL